MKRFFATGIVLLCAGFTHGFVAQPDEYHNMPPELVQLVSAPDDKSILTQNGTGAVVLDGDLYPILEISFDQIEDDEGEETFAVIALFEGSFDDPQRAVLIPVDFENERPDGRVILYDIASEESFVEEQGEVYVLGDDDDSSFGVSGVFESEDGTKSIKFQLAVSIGAGTSTFRVEEHVAYLNGDLGSRTYKQIDYLLKHHPEVKKIIFEQVPGSINDEVNVLTGRLIRDAGLTTELRGDSMIASGGVDLFLAGKKRIIAKGAMIGVHSWAGGDDDLAPADLPEDHPAHKMLIEYTEYVLPENGRAFYFYTINAAPAEDIHWMSEAEIEEWGIATE